MSESSTARLSWSLLYLLGTGLLLYGFFFWIDYQWNWSPLWDYRGQLFSGWLLTLALSIGAMTVSVLLGFSLMLGKRSPWLPLRQVCHAIVEVIRGSPLLVQLMVGYYIVASTLHIGPPWLVGMILLGLFEAAYLAEIFRGAVESIGQSQWESARAVGLDTRQTYRYVIIPQALRRALPGTTGELVSLIKSSSLLSVIGIEELVQKVRVMNSANYTSMEGYIPLALAYLIVTLPLSYWAKKLERSFAYET